jgi:hypothetical protein
MILEEIYLSEKIFTVAEILYPSMCTGKPSWGASLCTVPLFSVIVITVYTMEVADSETLELYMY